MSKITIYNVVEQGLFIGIAISDVVKVPQT